MGIDFNSMRTHFPSFPQEVFRYPGMDDYTRRNLAQVFAISIALPQSANDRCLATPMWLGLLHC